jgi:hypothetical protein
VTYVNRGNPSPPNPQSWKWPDEAAETLRKLWTSGLSCSQIAAELNKTYGLRFSRNAIIGKGQRLGLGAKAGAVRQPASAPGKVKAITPPKPRAPKSKPAPKAAKPKADVTVFGNGMVFERPDYMAPKRIPADQAFDALPGSSPRPWTERASNQCRWPIGDGLSCCLLKVDDRYCAEHKRLSVGSTAAGKQPSTATELMRSLRRYV